MSRRRANTPEKKAADRDASDFALTRAARRRKMLNRDGEGATLPSWEARQEAAKRAKKDAPAKTIGQRIAEQTSSWFRRWRAR